MRARSRTSCWDTSPGTSWSKRSTTSFERAYLNVSILRSRFTPVAMGAALALTLLPLGSLRAQKMPEVAPSVGSRVGDVAIDFTLKDLSNRTYTLKDLRGKQVVHVVFWATWCVLCLQAVPRLRDGGWHELD